MRSLNLTKYECLPWIPPSNTCPRRFKPTLNNRRRTLDRRPRTISAYHKWSAKGS
ncbi:hypothetical protein DICVIV_07573 [Dictyocaulus viviparus]|uniref:Uncharacterized protein n=1 Tax=Dictyocaulus viviparus TaxID=29172 RepID=A0A0D8XP03_DICVI|nr:hypothetical protein DICVIV_07573 [Dictyocaulus viviparus]